ncbi:MAG: UvrD-helicase domain-containing protein [Parachlamydiaceae bacterium]
MYHTLLNAPQQEAVETIYGPLLVLSGAGSGKTRVVTYRIAHLLAQGVPSDSILAVTFTNKAAAEMKARVHTLTQSHVLICTFHSLGARILRESIHLLGYDRSFTIYDAQDAEKLVKLCLEDIAPGIKVDAKQCMEGISKMKNALQFCDNLEPSAPGSTAAVFSEIYNLYQKKLKECNAVDFDDLIAMPIRLFKEHPDALAYYQKRWSFLLVDEYQDTNAAQYAIVKYLVANHNNLCVVGDPDQSIYSWRGANINNILNFESDFPGAKTVRLEQNYRSRSNILDASNALIQHNTGRDNKQLWSDRGPGEKITHYTADTEKGEAEFVAEKIQLHYNRNDIPLKEMAVFYRTNAQSRALEDRLLLHRIPYVIVGGVSFYQRREIKDILAYLRMVQSGVDFISFARTINLPKRGIGEATVDKIRVAAGLEQCSLVHYCEALIAGSPLQHAIKLPPKLREALTSYISIVRELREIKNECSLKELVKRTIEESGYLKHIEIDEDTCQERKENLNALIAKAAEWELGDETPEEESLARDPLEHFLEELSLKSSLDEAASSQDRVSLMTVHNSKGLEFDVVFLVGMEEDLFPHANSREDESAQEEERRLCYVGMTRAKEYLYLCDVRLRFLWGTTRSQRPSRFLKEIPGQFVQRARPSFQPYAPSKSFAAPKKEIIEEPFSDEMGPEILPGDAIFHQSFGVGKVTQAYMGSMGLTYKVVFSSDNKERTLIAKIARLRKM